MKYLFLILAYFFILTDVFSQKESSDFAVIGNKAYLISPRGGGDVLCVTNGTNLEEIKPVMSVVSFNGFIYYTDFRNGLHKLDTSSNTSIKLVSGDIDKETAITSKYLFFTTGLDSTGTELWRTDGTLEGTKLVKDIIQGRTSSKPQNLTVVNDVLFFTVIDENRKHFDKKCGSVKEVML